MARGGWAGARGRGRPASSQGSSRQAEAAGGAGTSLIVRACHLVGDTGEVKTGLCTDRSEFVLIVGGS